MVVAVVSLALLGAALLCLGIIALAVMLGHASRRIAQAMPSLDARIRRRHLTRAGR
jgi:hypothetical protein